MSFEFETPPSMMGSSLDRHQSAGSISWRHTATLDLVRPNLGSMKGGIPIRSRWKTCLTSDFLPSR